MFANPAFITGLGLCTPLGESVPATWEALLAGGFISDHSFAAGKYDKPRIHAIAEKAAREAAADAGWSEAELRDAALVVGTSKGPIESWIEGSVGAAGLGEVAEQLAGRLGLGDGPRLTLSTACASGLHALIRAAMLIDGGTRRVLVVAAESSLHPMFLASFKRLGVLAPPQIGCRPFDEDRAGFMVSEAAAAVCVESNHGGGGDKQVKIERVAMAGDAVHLTGGDPSGATLRRLLARLIDGRPVDLIHAHGTGTPTNDAIELAAIQSVMRGPPAALYSHKGAMGHSLGAAGLISVVLNCRCHSGGAVPPNVRTLRPMGMNGVEFSAVRLTREIRRSIAIASGFGGAMAGVSLVKA